MGYIYNPTEYWNKRESPNNPFNKDGGKHIQYIKANLSDCERILDFGVGVGRTFKAYDNIISVEGADITKKYKKQSYEESLKYPFSYLHTKIKNPTIMPYGNKEFDAVVGCSVLLHIRPENIEIIMTELARISKKVIAITYFNHKKPIANKTTERFFYNHNYIDVCGKNGFSIENINYDENNKQLYFIYCEVKR